LSLASAPLPVRRMVMESVISATTAIEAIKKHGDKAGDVLLAAMHNALTKLLDDPGFGHLSTKLRKELVELLGSLKK